MKRALVIAGTLAVAVSTTVHTSPARANVPTFSKDIAPIVFSNCATCHRPGEVAPMSFKEDKYAEILELHPGNRAVVHHAGVFVVDIPEGAKIVDGRLIMSDGKASTDRGAGAAPRNEVGALPGSSKLLSWVPGRGVDRHRADIGKRIPAGKYINWQVHYNPTGRPEKDRTKLGIWFNKVPVTHELLIRQAGDPLATTRGGLSLYRAEGKEVEYTADEGTTRRRSKTPNIPP